MAFLYALCNVVHSWGIFAVLVWIIWLLLRSRKEDMHCDDQQWKWNYEHLLKVILLIQCCQPLRQHFLFERESFPIGYIWATLSAPAAFSISYNTVYQLSSSWSQCLLSGICSQRVGGSYECQSRRRDAWPRGQQSEDLPVQSECKCYRLVKGCLRSYCFYGKHLQLIKDCCFLM